MAIITLNTGINMTLEGRHFQREYRFNMGKPSCGYCNPDRPDPNCNNCHGTGLAR